ncbi:rhodanese-like domain-containing protein [Corynebacterium sp. 335C]
MSLFGGLFGDDSKISAEEAVARVGDGGRLLDVRGAGERASLAPKKSTHIPLPDLPSRMAELPRNRTIVCVCARGPRAKAAARQLRSAGYDAYWFAGGVRAWGQAGGALK